MTPSKADPLATWQKLCAELGIAGASVGERRRTAVGAESWSSVVEHVHQDAKLRYYLLRIEAPRPEIVPLGTYATDETTRASLSRDFYGDDAEAQAARAEPAWRDWLRATLGS